MKKKRCRSGNNLKWKVVILALSILLLAVLFILQLNHRKKEQAEYKAIKQQEAQEQSEKKQNTQSGKKQKTRENREELEKKPEQDKKEPEKEKLEELNEKIRITNLKEYAAELMGENTILLEERLAEWSEENQLSVRKGTIFHVMIPESDPQSINFYIRLKEENRKKSSLVMLSYHPRENVVTASRCNYTEEEIKSEIWEDNGPAQRDVPTEPETETDGQQEGQDDTTGET